MQINESAYGGQKRALEPVELEFVIPVMGAWTEHMSYGGVKIAWTVEPRKVRDYPHIALSWFIEGNTFC